VPNTLRQEVRGNLWCETIPDSSQYRQFMAGMEGVAVNFAEHPSAAHSICSFEPYYSTNPKRKCIYDHQ
jgi:hypothetical protein